MIIKNVLRATFLLGLLSFNGMAQEMVKENSFENRQDFYIHSTDRGENEFYFYDNDQHYVQLQDNARLRLWSVAKGQPIKIFEKLGNIWKVSHTRDGRYLLIHSVLDYVDSLKLLDTKKQRLITLDSKAQVEGSSYRMDMSQDGKYLIFTEGDCSQRVVQVWDIKNFKFVSKFSTHIKNGILVVKVSPKNRFIVTHSRENSIDIWSIKGKHLHHIQRDSTHYYRGGIDISQDEKSVLIGNTIIDVEKGEVVSVLKKVGERYNTYTFNPTNNQEIIHQVRGEKNLIEVVNWQKNKTITTVDVNLSNYQTDFSTNGRLLLIRDKKILYLFDLKSKKIVQKVKDSNGYYEGNHGFQTTLDNKKLLYINQKNELLLIDIKSKKIIKKIERGEELKGLKQAVLSGNKKYLALNLEDGNVSIWDINHSQPISTFEENTDRFNNSLITLDSTGEYLVSFYNSTLKIWDAFKGKMLKSYKLDNELFTYLDGMFLTSNNRYLILYSDSKTQIWDMKEEKFISTKFKINKNYLVFNNDNSLVSIFEGKRVLLYDMKNMRIPIREFMMGEDNNWLGIDNVHHKIYQGGRTIPLLKSKHDVEGKGVSLAK